MRSRSCLAGIALCLLPASVLASDGVIELNHATALAGDPAVFDPAGYPILIRAPGSYRLTSDLAVPAGTDGIMVQASQVQIDLNGFTVRGAEACFPGSCQPSLAGSGIIGMPAFGGDAPTVRNGGVSNFGASCIDLAGGRIEDVRIVSCGEHGVHMRNLSSNPGTVLGSYISDTARSSIVFEAGGLYRDNQALRAGLASPSPTIIGGTATGGNLCDDGACSRRGVRRYYVSRNFVDGAQALSACELGFHMASRWELTGPSPLEYDTSRGLQKDDSGSGPPTNPIPNVWVRTGFAAATNQLAGLGNCANWTSAATNEYGTTMVPEMGWGSSSTNEWELTWGPCNFSYPVWCIED